MAEADQLVADVTGTDVASEPEGETDEGIEKLGRVGSILAIPLIPFVASWEAVKAGARAGSAAARWLGSAGAFAARGIGRLAGAAARTVVWPFRAGYRALTWLGHQVLVPLAWGWKAGMAAGLAVAGAVAAGWRVVTRPLRAVGVALASLIRRASLALRAAARAAALPIRTIGRAVVAMVKRWLVAMRGFARSAAVAARAAGRAARALAHRIGAALRTAARLLVLPVRAVARVIGGGLRSVMQVGGHIARQLANGLRAVGSTLARPIGFMVGVVSTGVRRAVLALCVVGRILSSAATAAGRRIHGIGSTIVRLVARPLVSAAQLVGVGARSAAAGGMWIATSAVHLLRWIWRPVARVGHQARDRLTRAFDPIRRAGGTLGAGLKAFVASAGSGVIEQWRRSRRAARRLRTGARQGLRDARLGVLRSVRAVRRRTS